MFNPWSGNKTRGLAKKKKKIEIELICNVVLVSSI